MYKVFPAPSRAGRRRLLGALAIAGAAPATARAGLPAVPAATPSVSPALADPAAAPADTAKAFDGMVPRERWLLRRDDC